MISIQTLKLAIYELVHSVEESEATSTSPDSTIYRLGALATGEALNTHSNEELDFFCKKYEISRKFFCPLRQRGPKIL